MQHLFIRKTLFGFVGLLLVVSLLGNPGGVGTVDADGGNRIYLPAVVNEVNAIQSSGVVFGPNATWKYFDKGTSPGSNWFAPGFNDGSWAAGSAPLGYGYGNERTTVSFGPNSSSKYITTYFRKTFNIDNAASITSMSFDLLRDDGAVVYLNGKEIYRTNMPSGTVGNTTLASACADGTVKSTIKPSDLVNGANTLAVEIHQCKGSSSDITFSLSLNATVGSTAPEPTAQPTATPPPATAPTPVPTTAPTQAPTLPPSTGKSYYVSTSGSSSNDGSSSRPWSLAHALGHPSALRAGDTIWVRGGTYSGNYVSRLRGSSGAPITVRAYPGERATLRKSSESPVLEIHTSQYVNFWGLEITASYSTRSTSRSKETYGIRVNQGSTAQSSHVNFINMVVHDVQSQGFGWWQNLVNSEIYGTLVYFNGTDQLDHGIYFHNVSGTKRLVDSIINDNASHGLHGYAETAEKGLNNLYLEGNTFFNNGSVGYTTTKSQYGILKRNILIGGLTQTKNPTVTNNYTYYPGSAGTALNIGYNAGSTGAKITNNYLMGGNMVLGGTNSSVTMTGNTVYAPGGTSGFSQSSYSNNSWLSSKPTGLKMFVRPNKYEPGRANITIYNWSKSSSVSITSAQLSGVAIKSGDQYELRNAQNFYGDVITGTYNGTSISVPMTGRSVAQPVGLSFKPASTFPEFGTFVLIVTGK
jgi:hypothetical protein